MSEMSKISACPQEDFPLDDLNNRRISSSFPKFVHLEADSHSVSFKAMPSFTMGHCLLYCCSLPGIRELLSLMMCSREFRQGHTAVFWHIFLLSSPNKIPFFEMFLLSIFFNLLPKRENSISVLGLILVFPFKSIYYNPEGPVTYWKISPNFQIGNFEWH